VSFPTGGAFPLAALVAAAGSRSDPAPTMTTLSLDGRLTVSIESESRRSSDTERLFVGTLGRAAHLWWHRCASRRAVPCSGLLPPTPTRPGRVIRRGVSASTRSQFSCHSAQTCCVRSGMPCGNTATQRAHYGREDLVITGSLLEPQGSLASMFQPASKHSRNGRPYRRVTATIRVARSRHSVRHEPQRRS
jgi:hypothetical protein